MRLGAPPLAMVNMGLSACPGSQRANSHEKKGQSAAKHHARTLGKDHVTVPSGPSNVHVCAAMFDYKFAATSGYAVSIAHLNELLPVRLPDDHWALLPR